MIEWWSWLFYGLLAVLSVLAVVIVSPRFKGGKDAPPIVTSSTVVPIPLIGVIAEFFKSPNTMIKRCYQDYGPVFTIPVRSADEPAYS
jgi:sterol 14-demethylase